MSAVMRAVSGALARPEAPSTPATAGTARVRFVLPAKDTVAGVFSPLIPRALLRQRMHRRRMGYSADGVLMMSCTMCLEWRPFDSGHFYPDQCVDGGLVLHCKACRVESTSRQRRWTRLLQQVAA